jgi:RNA methyltransferase, TrmH family
MYTKLISSSQNPLIKHIIGLTDKAKERRTHGLFVVEGMREIQLAVASKFAVTTLVCCPEIIDQSALELLLKTLNSELERVEVSTEVYEKIAYRGSTEGVLALCRIQNHTLDTLHFRSKHPLILVAEAPEKPGNIGALLRTCDAAGVDAVIIANPKTDLYNPNIIRSSVGALFTTQIRTGTTQEIIDYLKAQGVSIYCASLQAALPYTSVNLSGPAAIVVGTEADGLSEAWTEQSDQNIIIPMNGQLDSMNVSVAAGILIFEAIRQKA